MTVVGSCVCLSVCGLSSYIIQKFITNVYKTISLKFDVKVFIHPIVPVLKETRPIVMLFNTIYKRKAENLKGTFFISMTFF